MRSIILRLVP